MLGIAIALLCLFLPSSSAATGATQTQIGARLFVGLSPVRGTIAGHSSPLPSEIGRCSNCHSPARPANPATTVTVGAVGAASAASEPDRDAAPTLSARTLQVAQSRRRGPPSTYDPRSFCRLLRTGVDPAHVVVDRAMPRYALDDAECSALWAYVSQREANDAPR